MKKIFVKSNGEAVELLKEAQAAGAIIVGLPQEDEECSLCGKMAECRPYGEGYALVCYECGQKDKQGTLRRMNELNESLRVSRQGNA